MSTSHDVITDRIIAVLEAGTVPWVKPWQGKAGMPKNLASEKPYRGINVFLLPCLAYESPYFLTFKQAKARGGMSGKVSRAVPSCSGSDTRRSKTARSRECRCSGTTRFSTSPSVTGIDYPKLDITEHANDPIEAAERVVDGMPNAPRIEEGRRAAFYDLVTTTWGYRESVVSIEAGATDTIARRLTLT